MPMITSLFTLKTDFKEMKKIDVNIQMFVTLETTLLENFL